MCKPIKVALLSLLALSVAIIGFILYAFTPPKGDRYYLPEKYAGWICVTYNVEGAPSLPIEDGYLVHKIPENGILITSSEARFSPKRDQYYYYKDQGVRDAKELKHGGGYTKRRKDKKEIKFYFWVTNGDSLSDYEKYVKGRDPHADPPCGRWKQ